MKLTKEQQGVLKVIIIVFILSVLIVMVVKLISDDIAKNKEAQKQFKEDEGKMFRNITSGVIGTILDSDGK